jgi:hypothetical protein
MLTKKDLKVIKKLVPYAYIIFGVFITLNTIVCGPHAYQNGWYAVISLIFAGLLSIVIGILLLKKGL